MTARMTAAPKGLRRAERWLVGLAMAVVAVVLERIVMRAVRKEGRSPSPGDDEPTTFTSKGGAVDLPD